MDDRDITEGVRETMVGGELVRTGFRVLQASEFAGGLIDLEFLVEIPGASSRYLAVAADRTRQRPAGFAFEASFDGQALPDPGAHVPDMGGPLGVVEIDAKAPWHQAVSLNQFVRLEDAPALLPPSGTGCLEVRCLRPMGLATDRAVALTARDGLLADGLLRLSLRRDDLALKALADRLANQAAQGPPHAREQALIRLLSLRGSAQPQLVSLADHAEPMLAERIKQYMQVSL